mmetsp:Transcript_76924/g.220269  ORF Transcript_76924/g.220269 Transcript_76924/m.220269 type:complete len:211 (+) Transcript_76924:769-1401(+)
MPQPMFGIATDEKPFGPAASASPRFTQKRNLFAASMGLPCQNQGIITKIIFFVCSGKPRAGTTITSPAIKTSCRFSFPARASSLFSNCAFAVSKADCTRSGPPLSKASRLKPLYGHRLGVMGRMTASASVAKRSPWTTSSAPKGSMSSLPSTPENRCERTVLRDLSGRSSRGCRISSGCEKTCRTSSQGRCSLGSTSTWRCAFGGVSCRR